MRIAVGTRKDFGTGVLYIVIGLSALVIARNYALGSAARMGPGYFPTAVALLLTAVGVLLWCARSFARVSLSIASHGGPCCSCSAPSSHSGFHQSCRPSACCRCSRARMCRSERAVSPRVAARTGHGGAHRILRDCIRHRHGNSDAGDRSLVQRDRRIGHGGLRQFGARPSDGNRSGKPAVLLHRRLSWDRGRRAPRPRPGHHDRHAPSTYLRASAGRIIDHVGWDLLWRAIRRVDDGHSGEYAGRSFERGDRARWLPNGSAGQGRTRARHRGHRIFCRRNSGNLNHRAVRTSARRGGIDLRPGGVFLAHGSWTCGGDRACSRVAPARLRYDPDRAVAWDQRHGREFRRCPIYLRDLGAC